MFGCNYCHRIIGHHERCPNYEPPESNYICSKCGESILIGEEYIENNKGDLAHWECVNYAKDLVKFLDYEIKEMEEKYDT